MTTSSSIKSFFERDRRPGDLIFAVFFLIITLFLVSQIGVETKWVKGTKLFTQPMFWPAISLFGMAIFAVCHLISSVYSHKTGDRRKELLFWARSIEYAVWFMFYVWIVPIVGYLPCTILFTVLLSIRVGYGSDRRMLWFAALMGVAVVVIFKGFLSVKIPGGAVYEYLPDAIRNFMLLYL